MFTLRLEAVTSGGEIDFDNLDYKMNDAHLLKEITYLTRLLDKHDKPVLDLNMSKPRGQREKEYLQPVVSNQGIIYPKAKNMDRTIWTIGASKITQINKLSSLDSSKAVGESKDIFINPEKLKISEANKSVTLRRLVIPQNNTGNVEIQKSSTRKVFINPNFKQSVGKKLSEKPLHRSNISHAHVELNKPAHSVNITGNVKQPIEKRLPEKHLQKSESLDSFKVDKLSNQTSSNKRYVTKPQSYYINPHFKGTLFSQRGNECKKNISTENENSKELKNSQMTRRIVMFGTTSTCKEISNKAQINERVDTFQNRLTDHIYISKPSLNQGINSEAVVKTQTLKQNSQLKSGICLSKIMRDSPSKPEKEKYINMSSKNLSQKVEKNTTKESEPKHIIASCTNTSQPGPSKIYVNMEKWKSEILSRSTKTLKDLQPARNIYVNRSLLTGKLKDTQLKFSTTASKPKIARVYHQKPQVNNENALKENIKLIDVSKRMIQIKPNIIRARRRSSSSTCLVSLSKTKLVRKTKSVVQVESLKSVKRNTSGDLNTLRKLEMARALRNTRQVKRAISRYHLQTIHSNKISKLRKQSFVRSINNLVKINLHYQKNRTRQASENIQSKFKYTAVPRNKIELSKYYLNRKVDAQSEVKNRQIIKKIVSHKPVENMCKGSRKLVRSASSILMLSPTKLVRKKLSAVKSTPTPLRKLLPSIQMARLVKSKYKLNRSISVVKKNVFRYNKMDNIRRTMQNIQTSNPYSSYTRRKISSQTNQLPSLVNIGGVFYRSTHNKLTRKSVECNKAIANRGPVLQVRGQRFRLDKSGRTLKSLDRNPLGVNKLKRVDIGGVTFIRSKQGTSLIRTNTHTARTRLIQAKQRSIALLTKKLRKNNQPCPLYHRFGRCTGKETGTCNRIHNLKNIAICKKFVQGRCENTKCLLSHAIGPEKMPTCYHYLAGNCVRDNCPYLHVKVNNKAPVCTAFLQGYCADGEKCKKRHKNVCPEFEEKGTCIKGKYCPYPHPKSKVKPKPKVVKRRRIKVEAPVIEVSKEVSTFRYFIEELSHSRLEENVQDIMENDVQESTHTDESEEVSVCFSKRPKLGVLPAFIPLSMD